MPLGSNAPQISSCPSVKHCWGFEVSSQSSPNKSAGSTGSSGGVPGSPQNGVTPLGSNAPQIASWPSVKHCCGLDVSSQSSPSRSAGSTGSSGGVPGSPPPQNGVSLFGSKAPHKAFCPSVKHCCGFEASSQSSPNKSVGSTGSSGGVPGSPPPQNGVSLFGSKAPHKASCPSVKHCCGFEVSSQSSPNKSVGSTGSSGGVPGSPPPQNGVSLFGSKAPHKASCPSVKHCCGFEVSSQSSPNKSVGSTGSSGGVPGSPPPQNGVSLLGSKAPHKASCPSVKHCCGFEASSQSSPNKSVGSTGSSGGVPGSPPPQNGVSLFGSNALQIAS